MAEESRFAKIARVSVTQTAANVLTFSEFQTGVGLQVGATRGKGMAMLVDQIDYYVVNLVALLQVNTDEVRYGITTSDQVAAMSAFDDQRVLHAGSTGITQLTSGSSILKNPHGFQFFPALIWAEATLFIGSDGVDLPAPAIIRARIYYRLVELDQQLIFEVAQQFRIIS